MKEYTLPSGAVLKVDISDFRKSSELRKALLRALKDSPLEKLGGLDIDPADPKGALSANGKETLGGLAQIILSVMTSDDVEKALQACFDKVIYSEQKLTLTLFDDPKLAESARQDYDMICLRIAEVNCGPFFQSLLSKFRQLAATRAATRKSPSPAQTGA